MDNNKVLLKKGIYYNQGCSCIVSSVGNIYLTPNEKKLLDIILDQRGRKDIIIDEIWYQQGMVVSGASYYQLVKMLRRKFVAAGLETSCLKTIPRVGIVFINESHESSEKWGDKDPFPESCSATARRCRFYIAAFMMCVISVIVNIALSC